jgi:hypothetical protein
MTEKDLLNTDIVQLLIEKRKQHLQAISENQMQLEQIDRAMSAMTTVKAESSETAKVAIKWSKPVIDLLTNYKALMLTSEIVDSLYPRLDAKSRGEYIISLSGALGGLRERGRIKEFKVKGVMGKFWGLSEMFDGDKPLERCIPLKHKVYFEGGF